ncbi:hypothetical protein Spb1_34710 [Planctopirus ephydatiae]|uniref:FlgN protein n=1 Tax=Planctopirus ephydatiae TaxID=2528019 RepID=A0A518GSF8_9PLAN|nr:hypothetical protein [Planctopirus ephydatiae]QDV31526.1 hypothetical protein Spb1_34710 [Planctopirus ephydatiae]
MQATDGLQRLCRLIDAFESLQLKLYELMSHRWNALVLSRPGDAALLVPREQELLAQLQRKTLEREEFLRSIPHPSIDSLSLLDVARAWGQEPLVERAAKLRQQAGEIQKLSWTMWILTQRGIRHLDLIVDAVARGGAMAPTYDGPPGTGNVMRTQSALLDVSL